MTNYQAPHLHLYRVTIEARSPISLAQGNNPDYDVDLARDANGLPWLPPRSLRGVLRSYYRSAYPDCAEETVMFGFEDFKSRKGAASQLTFGGGYVHDDNNVAVIGLITDPDFWGGKPLLERLRKDAPLLRDHVGLNDRSVTDGRAKFQRTAVPVGTRFSFEISCWEGGHTASPVIKRLVELLYSSAFRIGGASAAGYGAIKVVSLSHEAVAISASNTIRTKRREPPSASLANTLGDPDTIASLAETVCIPLKSEGLMRCGQNGRSVRTGKIELFGDALKKDNRPNKNKKPTKKTDSESDSLLAQVSEPRVRWKIDGDRKETADLSAFAEGSQPRFIIAGSSLRGPIAHRTLYHYNRMKENWADKKASEDVDGNNPMLSARQEFSKRPKDLVALFGDANGEREGIAGRILFDDAEITGATAIQYTHNSIDPWSGGVIESALYTEEMLYNGQFDLVYHLKRPRAETGFDPIVLMALDCALNDLKSGQLPIGAKSLARLSVRQTEEKKTGGEDNGNT